MPTITIHNGGPGAINVTEASGQVTTMGEGTSNVFQSPLHVRDLGAEPAEPAEPIGPTAEPTPTPSTGAPVDLGGNNLGAADATVAGLATVTKAPTETTDPADTASVK